MFPIHWARDIRDPEHPHTLEELNVMQEKNIQVDDAKGLVKVFFTPTVEHCSMATIIGLCIRVKLLQTLPRRFKIDIFVGGLARRHPFSPPPFLLSPSDSTLPPVETPPHVAPTPDRATW